MWEILLNNFKYFKIKPYLGSKLATRLKYFNLLKFLPNLGSKLSKYWHRFSVILICQNWAKFGVKTGPALALTLVILNGQN